MTYQDKLLKIFNIRINKVIIDSGVVKGYQILLYNTCEEDFDVINLYIREGNDLLPDKFLIDVSWWEIILKEFDNNYIVFILTLSDYVKELLL